MQGPHFGTLIADKAPLIQQQARMIAYTNNQSKLQYRMYGIADVCLSGGPSKWPVGRSVDGDQLGLLYDGSQWASKQLRFIGAWPTYS